MGKHSFWLVLAGSLLLAAKGYAQPAAVGGAAAPDPEHVRYLVLERQWPFKRVRFFPGEQIAFKLTGERGWNRGRIQAVGKSSLVILDAEIPFSDIRKIRVGRTDYASNFAALSSGSLIGGGVLWLALGGINELEGKAGGGQWLAGAGAGAIVLGLAAREFTRHTWRVGRVYRLRSI